MTGEVEQLSPGTRALAAIEHDDTFLRILGSMDLSAARDELMSLDDWGDASILLGRWASDYPTATSELIRRIARDPASALKLAPSVLGSYAVSKNRLVDDADELLSAVFPQLTGPWRDAAADRPGVRQLLGLPAGEGYASVPEPEPSWLWPVGKPFPPADTVAGVQARLNYFDRGCGPVTGEWNDSTRHALERWQIEHLLEPTGEMDAETVERLGDWAPAAPE